MAFNDAELALPLDEQARIEEQDVGFELGALY